MAHDQTTSPTPRPTSIPFKKEGWLPAILTILAGILVPATAYYIHTQTYRHPTDIMMRQVYSEQDKAGGGGH
jgi:hypothetical protein